VAPTTPPRPGHGTNKKSIQITFFHHCTFSELLFVAKIVQSPIATSIAIKELGSHPEIIETVDLLPIDDPSNPIK
jgi:hypothetical protein